MWTISTIFLLALLSCGLFALGVYLNIRSEHLHEFDDAVDDGRDDRGLLYDWEGLTPFEQKRQLALYQLRVQTEITERERVQ